jgi:hypothetical protein
MAYTLTSKEAMWFDQFICDLGEEQLESIIIHG